MCALREEEHCELMLLSAKIASCTGGNGGLPRKSRKEEWGSPWMGRCHDELLQHRSSQLV